MVDQFKPWYFGVAFAFLFKYCTGMPDMYEFAEQERYRRKADAPRIEPPLWIQVMARRIEAQIQRDWHFGFVSWNYLFRSAINLSRSLYSYESVSTSEGKQTISAHELEVGATALCKALHGKYRDTTGKLQNVNGDITKLRYVPGLTAPAKRLLQNIEHTSRSIPGTQEVRRLMRFEIQGYRIKYGVPIFVTFSPDESHNLLMVRLSRTRQNDPILTHSRDKLGQDFSGRGAPSLDRDYANDIHFNIPLDDMLQRWPSYEERRVVMARDSLAAVDGFRIMVHATLKYLFGMEICWRCPDCNHDNEPCQDICGNSSSAEGGIFGRAEAAYVCIECQKSTGSLHAHMQVFIQCLHQHTPMAEILQKLKADGNKDVLQYLRYKEHVCRQVYADTTRAETKIAANEKAWPEYAECRSLVSQPAYLTQRLPACDQENTKHEMDARVVEGMQWLQQHLHEHVQDMQELKQHHVQLPSGEKGERVPLTHCKCADNPSKCKSDFPLTTWLIEKAVILC